MARAIRNAIRANRFARIVSGESFAIETPLFVIARQADSHESLEFPIRTNHATKTGNQPPKKLLNLFSVLAQFPNEQ